MKHQTMNHFGTNRKSGKAIFQKALVFCLTAGFTMTGAVTVFAEQNSTEYTDSASSGTVIGEETAQNYAFADAGVDPVSADYVSTKYDYENGQFVYEVDFTADSTEYEYQIGAYDGTVIKKSVEYWALKNSAAVADNSGTAVTLEEAEEIALLDTELTDEEIAAVTYTKEKLDYDDGISVYDIDFYTDSAEYEYEISAITGDILSMSTELLTGVSTTGSSGSTSSGSTGSSGSASSNAGTSSGSTGTSDSSSYISVDEAKAIALERAGLSESEVTFKKAKLERDDGIMVYEIEFYQGRTEYECTLNASTGKIMEFDMDWDD